MVAVVCTPPCGNSAQPWPWAVPSCFSCEDMPSPTPIPDMTMAFGEGNTITFSAMTNIPECFDLQADFQLTIGEDTLIFVWADGVWTLDTGTFAAATGEATMTQGTCTGVVDYTGATTA